MVGQPRVSWWGIPTSTRPLTRASSDNDGGAFISSVNTRWDRPGVHVQRITREGLVAPSWPNAGLALTGQDALQREPVIIADGAGGGIVAWEDYRNGGYAPLTNPDLYAQRFTED